MSFITEMVRIDKIFAVGNRMLADNNFYLSGGIELLGVIPDDSTVRQFDRDGRSLWQLPPENKALLAVKRIAQKIVSNNKDFFMRN